MIDPMPYHVEVAGRIAAIYVVERLTPVAAELLLVQAHALPDRVESALVARAARRRVHRVGDASLRLPSLMCVAFLLAAQPIDAVERSHLVCPPGASSAVAQLRPPGPDRLDGQ